MPDSLTAKSNPHLPVIQAMPVTEVAILNFIPPHDIHTPALLPLFRFLSERQSAWSGFPLRFFQNASKEGEIYLVSGWKDVPAHNGWIASDANQELLTLLKSYLTVASLMHLEIDITGFPDEVTGLRGWGRSEGDGDEGGDKVIWRAEGKDAEGKEDGVWRLIGYGKGFEEVTSDTAITPLKRIDLDQ
ncbi:hypothetical protein EVG20_g8793 [Dentipellis fragilis]|uniref:ABM domain-containing protein n=1 Tax=Dentipellis fragilis TaxID=205917 RepID=A0A4Y9Y7I8_9AGAM|nr:hypothetical protein EVG20_g8793 [Dentipellis fragilis]